MRIYLQLCPTNELADPVCGPRAHRASATDVCEPFGCRWREAPHEFDIPKPVRMISTLGANGLERPAGFRAYHFRAHSPHFCENASQFRPVGSVVTQFMTRLHHSVPHVLRVRQRTRHHVEDVRARPRDQRSIRLTHPSRSVASQAAIAASKYILEVTLPEALCIPNLAAAIAQDAFVHASPEAPAAAAAAEADNSPFTLRLSSEQFMLGLTAWSNSELPWAD